MYGSTDYCARHGHEWREIDHLTMQCRICGRIQRFLQCRCEVCDE